MINGIEFQAGSIYHFQVKLARLKIKIGIEMKKNCEIFSFEIIKNQFIFMRLNFIILKIHIFFFGSIINDLEPF